MAFRRQPLSLYTAALAVYFFAAILPISFMLGQFIVRILQQPSHVANILIDTRQLLLLSRSLLIAFSATLVAFGLGLPVAFILAARDLPFRRFFYLLVLIPVMIPSYVMAGAWIHLFSPSGFINRALMSVFGPSVKLTLFSKAGCAWCLGISFFPIVAIIVATGLSKLDNNLEDIARLSTNRWGVFRHSTLPQILPHLLAAGCLVMIFVLAQYGVPSLLGINTYPVEIFAQFSAFYDDTMAVATAIPLVALVVFLVLLQQRIMRSRDYVRITPSSETVNPIRLNKRKNLAIAFLVVLFLVTTVLPLSSVFIYAKGSTKILSTLNSYGGSIMTTSLLALLAAFFCTSLAFPIGQHLACSKGSVTRIIDVLCWLPIAIPGTVVGLGLIKMANVAPSLHGSDSFGILLLCAYVGMFSAFSIRIFEAAYRRSDPNVAEAGGIDCPRWHQRLFHIDIPIHSGAIAASVVIVFVLAIGELNATVLLIPPGRETLGVSIDNLLHYGANTSASVLCLTEAALAVIAATVGLCAFSGIKRVIS